MIIWKGVLDMTISVSCLKKVLMFHEIPRIYFRFSLNIWCSRRIAHVIASNRISEYMQNFERLRDTTESPQQASTICLYNQVHINMDNYINNTDPLWPPFAENAK